MSLMLKILRVLGCVLLAAVLLLLWVIIVPRHFWLEYTKADSLEVKMNIAFFKLRLFPLPEFTAKKNGKKGERAENQTQKTEGQPQQTASAAQTTSAPQPVAAAQPQAEKTNPFADIQLSMELVKQVVSSLKGVMARIFKAIKFRDVSFTVPLHHSDVHKTQQLYGAVTNSFYALAVFLQKHLQITFKSPLFVADFADRHKDSVYFYCQITASPVLLLAAAWYGYNQYNNIMETNKKVPAAPEKEINNG